MYMKVISTMRCTAREATVRGVALPSYFAKAALQQRVLPEAVGPDQGVDRDAPLG